MSATKEIKGDVTEITLTANIYREDDDYVAECVEIGTVGQGATAAEAINDLRESTELLLEEAPETLNHPPRLHTTLEDGIRDLEQAFDRYTRISTEQFTARP